MKKAVGHLIPFMEQEKLDNNEISTDENVSDIFFLLSKTVMQLLRKYA